MRFSLMSVLRLSIVTALVSSAAAIGLARLAPAPKGWRMRCPVQNVNVNAFFLAPSTRGSIWVDRDAGRTIPFPSLGDDEMLEYASGSPWRDERGHSQVIGRWSRAPGDGASRTAYGLARISYPDGEILDHVETEVVPLGSPCWFPGTLARALFAGGDGKLYQCSFETATGSEGLVDRPHPLAWDCEVPGGDNAFFCDPHWPSDPRFEHLILVGLRRIESIGDHPRTTPIQVWWLRLSDDGGMIEEAGRLLEPSPSSGDEVNERCPAVGRTPDGGLVLAYLRKADAPSWELRLVRLAIDPDGRPRTEPGPGAKLADGCVASQPIFSSDGRSIHVIQSVGEERGVLRRFPTEARPESAPSLTFARSEPTSPRASR